MFVFIVLSMEADGVSVRDIEGVFATREVAQAYVDQYAPITALELTIEEKEVQS